MFTNASVNAIKIKNLFILSIFVCYDVLPLSICKNNKRKFNVYFNFSKFYPVSKVANFDKANYQFY